MSIVLIISKRADGHTDLVCGALAARGIEALRLNTDQVGVTTHLSLSVGLEPSAGIEISAPMLGRTLSAVDAVWFRRMIPPQKPSYATGKNLELVSRWESIMQSTLSLLEGKIWFSNPASTAAARLKPLQLAAAQASGLAIPPTLVSNDRETVSAWFNSGRTRVIYKPFESYHIRSSSGERSTLYTSEVKKDTLRFLGERLIHAPCTFQEFLPRAGDLRVTFVDGEMFSARISTPPGGASEFDWRRDNADSTMEAFDLPPLVAEAIRRLMSRLGLRFGCLDFVLDGGEKLVFLEVNPCGQWYFVELATRLPILDALVEALSRACAHRSPADLAAHFGRRP